MVALETYLQLATRQLHQVDHKCTIPPLATSKAKRLTALMRLAKGQNYLDTRIIRAFRIWQKALLSPYIDQCQQVMFQSKKSILKMRLQFIAHIASLRARQAFVKWRLYCSTQAG